MLHFSRGIAFGVNIGNFFQLECALECDGVMNSSPEIEEVAGGGEFFREFFARVHGSQDLFNLAGNTAERIYEGDALLVSEWFFAPARGASRKGKARSAER